MSADAPSLPTPTPQEWELVWQEAMAFAGIGLYRYRFDGTVIFMDRGAMRIFDLEGAYADPAELAGKKIETLLTYRAARGRFRAEIRKQGQIRGWEHPFRTLTGHDRWVMQDSYLVRDPPSGEETIQVVLRDITDRKRAEEALRELSARQEAILAAVPDIIMEVDANKVYTWANRAGLEFFGDDVVGQEAAHYFEIQKPYQLAALAVALQRALSP